MRPNADLPSAGVATTLVMESRLAGSMLPKLADLWDQAEAIFLAATNHRRHLDPAITRANRFDLLLYVAPPPWSRKKSAAKLGDILKIKDSKKVEAQLEKLVDAGSAIEKQLDLFTISELGTFFDHIKRAKKVKRAKKAPRPTPEKRDFR